MNDLLEAINSQFLIRLFFGMIVYWAIGILSEGIIKPIQKNLAEKFLNKTQKGITLLEVYANESCSQIDDLLIGAIAPVYRDFCRLVTGDDLSPSDQQYHRQLIASNYQFSILLQKLLDHD